MKPPRAVVIVGASLSGLRVAEALRRRGYGGRLSLVGAEPHLPYDRPPLSKQVLAGDWEPERAALTDPDRLHAAGIEIVIGVPARAVDRSRVHLEDGRTLAYDALVIATGATARTWAPAPASDRVHVLRTVEDSLRLRAALRHTSRLIVVGGGFIGLEAAAVARSAGVEVTVLEAASTLLQHAVGRRIGGFFDRLHRQNEVDLRLGVAVKEIIAAKEQVIVGLTDGSQVVGDHALVGIGVQAETGWLTGLGLDDPAGVACDPTGRVEGSDAQVWALGDVARWRRPGGAHRRHEHWSGAVDEAAIVAAAILDEPVGELPLPYFWSQQYDVNFQMVGHPELADEVVVLEPGDGGDRGTVFGFVARDAARSTGSTGIPAADLTAVAAFHNPRRFLQLRRQLEFDPAVFRTETSG